MHEYIHIHREMDEILNSTHLLVYAGAENIQQYL